MNGRIFVLMSVVAYCAFAQTNVPPAFANEKYGSHERQRMSVWLPNRDTAVKGRTPALIVIHGGGWKRGDRMKAAGEWFNGCRKRRIALVAISYRLIGDANNQGVKPPVKACLDDVVEAIQYVVVHAKTWNIDSTRIGLAGGSAGACSALYSALLNGNAFGICAVYAASPQTTLDPKEMKEWIPNSNYGAHAFGYDNFDDWLSHRSDCLEWIERFSPAALLRKCPAEKAPKFFYSCVELPPKGELPKDPTHAAMFCIKFEALCKEKGVPCKVCGQGEFLDFLLRR